MDKGLRYPGQSSWISIFSHLSSLPSPPTVKLQESWSTFCFQLPNEEVNKPANSSIIVLSSVTALFSTSFSSLPGFSYFPVLLKAGEGDAGNERAHHTSGQSASLRVAIDYVHIKLWTQSRAEWAPIDPLAQSSHGPWSTAEVPTDPPLFLLCHHFVPDKSSHSSGMIIFFCRINPGDYGYGNADWLQDLRAISSSDTVSPLRRARGRHVAQNGFVYVLEHSRLLITFA